MGRRTLRTLIALSLADGLLVLVLVWAGVRGRLDLLAVFAPTHGTLYVMLVVSLAVLAHGRRVGWRFVLAVMLLGPLASIPGLELYRRGGRS